MIQFLNLATGSPLGSTRLEGVTATDPVTIQGRYLAILASPQSRVCVWSGAYPTGTPITIANATGTEGSFKLTAQGYNFQQGLFTVGFMVDTGGNLSSICATGLLNNGQLLSVQSTTVIPTNQYNAGGKSYLTVNYSTPEGNLPNTNRDWVDLFTGDTPVMPPNKLVTYQPVPTNNNAGTMTLEISPPLTYQSPYILEYNPGYTIGAISSYFTFKWNVG